MINITDEELIDSLLKQPCYRNYSRMDIEIALEEYRKEWAPYKMKGVITNDDVISKLGLK